jgi:hypothetical protein
VFDKKGSSVNIIIYLLRSDGAWFKVITLSGDTFCDCVFFQIENADESLPLADSGFSPTPNSGLSSRGSFVSKKSSAGKETLFL